MVKSLRKMSSNRRDLKKMNARFSIPISCRISSSYAVLMPNIFLCNNNRKHLIYAT